MKKCKEEKGSMAVYVIVTLVSFCLILTGIYISTSSVRKAQIKTDIKIKEVYENSYAVSESDKITDLVKNGKIKIGDYVAYTPAGDASYTVDGTYSGTGSDQVINKEELNWRVFDIAEDGRVRLISATPTTAKISLRGENGYNNGVYLLDELCNTLYKGENATAKNLKIEDIQDKMDLNYWDYHEYEGYGNIYIQESGSYICPSIFYSEKNQNGNNGENYLDISEQESLITGWVELEIGTTVMQTYWYNNMSVENYILPFYYETFHNIETSYYLSSRSISIGWIKYRLTYVTSSTLGTGYLLDRDGGNGMNTIGYRPMITLDRNVEIDTSIEGKDGKTPETAYVIK